MTKVDIEQNHKITLIVALITGLSALTGLLVFFEKRKHTKLQQEIDQLDKSIKELQLEKLKNGK